MKSYFVKYRMHSADDVKGICVPARNRAEAYDKAVYEKIAKTEGSLPYSAWVDSVTYINGKCKKFNSFEGKRY